MRQRSMVSALRILQIRLLAKFLEVWGRTEAGRNAIVWLRGGKYRTRVLASLVGYRQTFPSFEAAAKYAGHFQFVGHEHPRNIAHHRAQAWRLRESDYPVLFHLSSVAPMLRKIFDLGGNIGNLFYSLANVLQFSDEMSWIVYDLPLMLAEGRKLSETTHESRLQFTDNLAAASGCDLFIASGSLHYFEQPLAEMFSSLAKLPPRLLINRTPCTRETAGDTQDVVTVQDNEHYLVPSIVHNQARLVRSLLALGYHLRASWPVYERCLWLPLYPDLSLPHYWGFYFVLEGTDAMPPGHATLPPEAIVKH